MRLSDGNAATADLSTKEKRLRRYARFAPIRKHISREKWKIINRLFGGMPGDLCGRFSGRMSEPVRALSAAFGGTQV